MDLAKFRLNNLPQYTRRSVAIVLAFLGIGAYTGSDVKHSASSPTTVDALVSVGGDMVEPDTAAAPPTLGLNPAPTDVEQVANPEPAAIEVSGAAADNIAMPLGEQAAAVSEDAVAVETEVALEPEVAVETNPVAVETDAVAVETDAVAVKTDAVAVETEVAVETDAVAADPDVAATIAATVAIAADPTAASPTAELIPAQEIAEAEVGAAIVAADTAGESPAEPETPVADTEPAAVVSAEATPAPLAPDDLPTETLQAEAATATATATAALTSAKDLVATPAAESAVTDSTETSVAAADTPATAVTEPVGTELENTNLNVDVDPVAEIANDESVGIISKATTAVVSAVAAASAALTGRNDTTDDNVTTESSPALIAEAPGSEEPKPAQTVTSETAAEEIATQETAAEEIVATESTAAKPVTTTDATVGTALTTQNTDTAASDSTTPQAVAELVGNYPGKLTMVVFWSTGSEGDGPSFTWLNDMHQRYVNRGLQIVAVNQDETARKGEAYAVKQGAKFEITHDRSGNLSRALWVGKLPATYLLNDAGELLGSHAGFNDDIRGSYEDEIRRLLKTLG